MWGGCERKGVCGEVLRGRGCVGGVRGRVCVGTG